MLNLKGDKVICTYAFCNSSANQFLKGEGLREGRKRGQGEGEELREESSKMSPRAGEMWEGGTQTKTET